MLYQYVAISQRFFTPWRSPPNRFFRRWYAYGDFIDIFVKTIWNIYKHIYIIDKPYGIIILCIPYAYVNDGIFIDIFV